MKIPPHTHLLFIGDSVTDCGRARPVGVGPADELGHGYVAELDALIKANQPANPIRVTNMGIGGNTVRDLEARWQTDVLALRPDWLSVMIGINDVWRQFDGLAKPEEMIMPELFESTYERLLSRTRHLIKELVLMTPYYIEPTKTDAMRLRMDEYGRIVQKLAQRHQAIYVDTQAAFDHALTRLNASVLSADRVHPYRAGHMILALAFLQDVLGLTLNQK
jgi:lysophospholipase L1-like esterase